MNRLTALIRRYPIAAATLLIAILAGVFLLRPSRPQDSTAVVQPTPAAAPGTPTGQPPQVAPSPAATPAPAAASPPPPPQAAGRADPFVPLVQARAGPAPGPPPVSLPPPAPLPPPLFPGPGGPGAPVSTPPPPPARLSAGAQLIGVLGDTGGVAIIRIGGQVYIVAQGELIQDRIRVELVDANEGLMVLIEDGQRFEVRFG